MKQGHPAASRRDLPSFGCGFSGARVLGRELPGALATWAPFRLRAAARSSAVSAEPTNARTAPTELASTEIASMPNSTRRAAKAGLRPGA